MVAVKVCGVRTTDIASLCAELSVDFAGLNFVSTSRRSVDRKDAPLIREALGAVLAVGLFRDAPYGDVLRTIDEVQLPWVQLHGDESPEVCTQIRALGIKVIKALPVTSTVMSDLQRYRDAVDILLLDAPTPGSGTSWSWEIFASHRTHAGSDEYPPIFIAGGLTPANVVAAMSIVTPDGVDVASGIETDGEIDPAKVRAFCATVRALQPV